MATPNRHVVTDVADLVILDEFGHWKRQRRQGGTTGGVELDLGRNSGFSRLAPIGYPAGLEFDLQNRVDPARVIGRLAHDAHAPALTRFPIRYVGLREFGGRYQCERKSKQWQGCA